MSDLILSASLGTLFNDPLLGPLFRSQFARLAAYDYDSFVDALESDLESLIKTIEEGASLRTKDGEDRLTDELILGLKAMGYQASHDTYINGHSDIVVSSKFNHYTWIGEAKIHDSYQWLYEGFCQLATRYSIGTYDGHRGGLVIYIRNVDAEGVVLKWREELVTRSAGTFGKISITPDHQKNPLRFESAHKHSKSGLDYRVRHFGVVMNFSPLK
ncbi:hypothetical protein QSH18_13295 [Xanthomonas sp. NCPPB 2654]|uniref:hypothetical protein n=1 Tax=unclassified Xanthomonas TaxID=2643310 RepID=UPI0021E0D77A|nr:MULTISPECIES: hypothetical protein [unclassified Xanthomonas]MDL5366576.1 hypothetical protein [Xanthomonas sp. NCPPB 2654]UYC21285.1 hypothetical protein NUG20_02975 [Xanthomonas sp. CFBP 8443]